MVDIGEVILVKISHVFAARVKVNRLFLSIQEKEQGHYYLCILLLRPFLVPALYLKHFEVLLKEFTTCKLFGQFMTWKWELDFDSSH